ncbi:MAG: hypothetical protein J6J58_03330, partial [Oscillospiraceae bacterium]|nr:hypothetical protein [Oscillospiraceae bacterium]
MRKKYIVISDDTPIETDVIELTEEQEKALLEEIEKLRQDKAALISRVSSLEQSLYWLRKKVFGRMSEKSLPLDPNQLFLFSKEAMS